MSSLFVGNLSSHVRHRELENAFRRFGRSNLELKDGFGFVVYEEYRDAERALKALQGRSVCGEQPSISWAKRHRPFQRFSGKGNSVRGSWDKYQRQATRRRPSLESDRGSDDDKREDKFLDKVKDGSRASETREEAVGSIVREEEWKDPGPEKLAFEEEAKDMDPLDSGRWDPHMEGSPEHVMGDGAREDEDPFDGKDKEDDRGNTHEKLQGSPVDKHRERSLRGYRNSFDQYKRGRDAAIGRPQERCYNCGQLGHVQRQCRLRPSMNNMHPRDGGYDGRRNELRYLRGGGGFRGMGGGRFRGMDGSRRVFNRDMEGSYARSRLRRRDSTGDRKHYDPADTKSREKSRRRRHRSESPNDSSSRGRSKRKHKKSSKKSSRSTRKRRRSSSDSPSPSHSPQSSSSSPSGSRSRSRSGSRSRSVASRSQSSKSRSQSSSSVSHSRPSRSQSSRSRSQSASSPSRSRSGSSRSRKSHTKSESRSSHSRSPGSRDIPSQSPKPMEANSPPSRSNSKGGSRSPKHEEDTSYKTAMGSGLQEKQVFESVTNEDLQEKDSSKYLSEGQDSDQQYAKRKERRRLGSREAKKQKYQNRSDTEEPHYETGIQSNGGKHGSKIIKSRATEPSIHQNSTVNEQYSRDSTGGEKASLKGSEPIHPGHVPDTKCSIYMAIMKEGHRGVGGHDGGQELATESFGAARLWPWEAMLYRRLKRGPISTANYEKRKVQNEEFGMKDKFVRSSSGWWEKHSGVVVQEVT